MDWVLSPEEEKFVEEMGRFYQQYGIARIGGRMLALLMIAPEPLSLDDISRLLKVSRASVSTNARYAVFSPLIRRTSRPGDRRDYFQFAPDAWDHYLHTAVANIRQLEQIAHLGFAALVPGNAAGKARLDELVDLCEFYIDEVEAMTERWRQHRQAAHGSDHHERRRS